MSLRPSYIFCFFSAAGINLTSKSDVYRRQILTHCPHTEKFNVGQMQPTKTKRLMQHAVLVEVMQELRFTFV